MYYYIENKTEYIQIDNLYFNKVHIPQNQPLGKILSELINFDYSKLSNTYNELYDKREFISWNEKSRALCKTEI